MDIDAVDMLDSLGDGSFALSRALAWRENWLKWLLLRFSMPLEPTDAPRCRGIGGDDTNRSGDMLFHM